MRQYIAVGLSVLAGAAGLSFVSAPASFAASGHWDCGVIDPGVWCIYNVRHSYYLASAQYGGNDVCVKLIRDDNGATYNQDCGSGMATVTSGRETLFKPLSYNGGPSRHTILGTWYY